MPPNSEPLAWIDSQAKPSLSLLMALSRQNSGSFNLPGLSAMHDEISALFAPLADSIESVALQDRVHIDDSGEKTLVAHGNMLRLRKREDAPFRILLCGHMDTVFPADCAFQSPILMDDGRLHGPGVADMKGGLLSMHLALSALEQSATANQIGWEVMINPDEETGSIASAPYIAESARRNHVGLVYEPALADGTLAGARKGSGNFSLLVKGRSAHAGREFEKGRNAIAALAKAMQALDALNGSQDGLSINLGRISGGGALNTVADTAVCHFNVRSENQLSMDAVATDIDRVVQMLNNLDGISAELHGKFNRQPKVISPEIALMFDWLKEVGEGMGVAVRSQPTGGCCDGNNLAAEGMPNIDTLGVRGANIHTDQEFMLVDSLVERAKLSYLFMQKMASQSEQLLDLRVARPEHLE